MDREEIFTRIIEKSNDLIETATKLGVAYVGYKSVNHWGGSLAALIALKLAQGGNLAGGAAGIGVLSIMGLTQLPRDTARFTGPPGVIYPFWWPSNWPTPFKTF